MDRIEKYNNKWGDPNSEREIPDITLQIQLLAYNAYRSTKKWIQACAKVKYLDNIGW